MLRSVFLTCLALLACLLAPPLAKADMFTFEFVGTGCADDVYWSGCAPGNANYVSGPIKGTIELNSTGAAAHVWIEQFPANMGALPVQDAVAWSSVIKNDFTVVGGQITAASFQAMQYQGWSAQFNLNFPPVNHPTQPGGTNYLQIGDSYAQGPNGLQAASIQPAAVPEPSTLLFQGSWLLGLGFLLIARRTRPKTSTV